MTDGRPSTTRLAWLDDARGLAIVLVVVMHSDIMAERLGWPTIAWLDPIWAGFSLVRMPLLLLLSGFLLPRSLTKSSRAFLYGKWSMIAWPYLVWITIRWIPEARVLPPWDPEVWFAAGYLWYLFYLLGYYLLALLLKFANVPYIVTAAAFWIASWFDTPFADFTFFGTFFFLGAALWNARPGVRLPQHPLFYTVVAAMSAVSWIVSAVWGKQIPHGAIVLLAAAPLALVLAVFQRAGGSAALKPLSFVGRNSLVYYVAHFPIISAGARVLHLIAPEWTEWYLIPLSVITFTICTALAIWREKIPIRWLFVAPRFSRLRHRPRPRTESTTRAVPTP